MKKICIIDTFEYIRSNCFQHQLYKSITSADPGVEFIAVKEFLRGNRKADVYTSLLKQRTLLKHSQDIKNIIGASPIIVYDQDPWEAFRSNSEFVGSYDIIKSNLNVEFFAVTTSWWADYLNNHGYKSKFVKMWLLPEYTCTNDGEWAFKKFDTVFVGKVHPYRKFLFDELEKRGIKVNVFPSTDYASFLKILSSSKIYLHNEDFEMETKYGHANLRDGLWIKDIEAIGRRCFSVRNYGSGSETYQLHTLNSFKMFDTIDTCVDVINNILRYDLMTASQITSVDASTVKNLNFWFETAKVLTWNT